MNQPQKLMIRITRAEPDNWYRDKIGRPYEVESESKRFFTVKNEGRLENKVQKRHCEFVSYFPQEWIHDILRKLDWPNYPGSDSHRSDLERLSEGIKMFESLVRRKESDDYVMYDGEDDDLSVRFPTFTQVYKDMFKSE